MTPQEVEEDILSVEQEISSSPVSPAHRKRLFSRLGHSQAFISSLVTRADQVKNVFQAASQGNDLQFMEQRIVSLYGRIHSLSVDYEVKQLEEEAESLEEVMENGDFGDLLSRVHQLKAHIATLCHTHALSKENQEVVKSAKRCIKKATAILSDTPSNEATEESTMPVNFGDVDFDAVSDLFEVARFIHMGEMSRAKALYETLPDWYRGLFRKHHMLLTGSTPSSPTNSLETIQALIATAYNLANYDNDNEYLSAPEINQMFRDVEYIVNEDS